jgi:hypothetical protein
MNDAQFEALWNDLVDKKYEQPAGALTKQERLFFAANMLRGSVPRSGFIGYFENSSGDDLRDAHEALRIMRLDDILKLLERAQQIVLRDQPLPVGDDLIEVFPADLTEEAAEKASDELDAALRAVQESFYKCDDRFFEALCKFADDNGLS